MKAHKYWSIGALITMIGTFYTGYKGSKSGHRYFACSTLICMIMSMYTGHKMISGNKRTRPLPCRVGSLSEVGLPMFQSDDSLCNSIIAACTT